MRRVHPKGGVAFVLDWDDVVFDTAAFKRGLAADLSKKGIPEGTTLDTVGIAKDSHGYNPAIHARMIVGQNGGSARAIERIIWSNCRSLAGKLLFKDAVAAIRGAHRAKALLYVLSAGRKRFQRTRIYGSGLIGLFKKIYIVDVTSVDAAVATKVRVLELIAKHHERLVFLDDRPKTIAGVQKARSLKGKVLPVLVWRQKEKPPRGMQAVRGLSWKGLKKIAIHNGFQPY